MGTKLSNQHDITKQMYLYFIENSKIIQNRKRMKRFPHPLIAFVIVCCPPKVSSVSSESTKALVRFLHAHAPLPSDEASASFAQGLCLLRVKCPLHGYFCFLRGNPLFPSW